jgi:hypothetical protein
MRRAGAGIPSNLTVAELQSILEGKVIPALTSAAGHMAAAEAGGGPIFTLSVEDEVNEIDVGEIYAFHAGLLAARAGLRILTAYDYGLPGADGTYGWVDEIVDLDECSFESFFEPIGGGSPYYRLVQRGYGRTRAEATVDSVAAAILRYNLEQRPAFLASRNDGMTRAFDDLLAVRNLLEAGVAAIRAEGDAQENDVIKIADLTDLDDDIASGGDRPNFATNFTTVEDVLDWVEAVLSGPYQVDEDGDLGPIQVTVDLAGFFRNAPADWKTLLPYHEFHDPDTWLTPVVDSFTYDATPGFYYYAVTCQGATEWRTDVDEIRVENHDIEFDPLEFTDAGGNPIDLETEKIPHLPDYTLHGLFPGANRAKWLEIHDNAGW